MPTTEPALVRLAPRVEPAGQAEVGDARVALAIDEDVVGLEVAVQDVALVGVGDGVGDLADELGRLARRERPLLAQLAGETVAVDEGHRVVGLTIQFAEVEQRDDARVVQGGGGASFLPEPRQ